MQSSVVFRRFQPQYLDQVAYINKTCLPENYSDNFFIDIYNVFPETFIIAEKNNLVIGYIMCRIESTFPSLSFRRLRRGHIISLAVLPQYRNQGIGKGLIEQVLQSMKTESNIRNCYLEVRVSNYNAIKLYKNAGFELEKIIKGYYADGENAYIMEKDF